MGKIREIARFSFTQPAAIEPKAIPTPKFRVATEDVTRVVDENPGISYREIGRKLGARTKADYAAVSSTLWRMMKAKRLTYIKRMVQDGVYRYYPVNYKLSTDPKPPIAPNIVEAPPAKPATQLATEDKAIAIAKAIIAEAKVRDNSYIVGLAKDYVWETGDQDLKKFVEWVEKRTTKEA